MAASKTVLIVGANRGIGFQLATRFRERGYDVCGTYRPQTAADPSVAYLHGMNTLKLDLTDETSIQSAAKDFGDRPLDILVNCAGLYHLWDNTPFMELSGEGLVDHFRVNVVGPFLVTKAFLPVLHKAPLSKVINVSSDFGSIADNTGGNVPYRISKAGVNQLTKTMAEDLAKLGETTIRTLAVHPGFLATKMTGFYGEDDMETCMTSLVSLIERLGTEDDGGIPSGAYVRWNGERMAY